MRATAPAPVPSQAAGSSTNRTVELLQAYFAGQRHLRKGICLLNAGQFDLATEEFMRASRANPAGDDFARFLVVSLASAERYTEAAEELARQAAQRPEDTEVVIRLALLQSKSGKPDQAVRTLREAVADNMDSAELHFQLGTILAAVDEAEEAELRFAQAVAIDKDHPDALAGLALCHGVKQEVAQAVHYLERAQRLRPHDARIALLLSHAAKAGCEQGTTVSVRAEMPDVEPEHSDASMARLGRLMEEDADFVEAFLSVDAEEVDQSVFNLLLATLNRAIEHDPHRANLHFYSGKVLDRLGRAEEAIAAAERAVDLDRRYVKAFILLAELYRQTDRCADAATRLEQTVLMGAEYADTYYLLGNLYRDTGQIKRARWAYEHALEINGRFEAARKALDSLAA